MLLIGLVLALVPGCTGDEEPTPRQDGSPLSYFPTHRGDGDPGFRIEGALLRRGGCLLVADVHSGLDYLVAWPEGLHIDLLDGAARIEDRRGAVVVAEGEYVRMSGTATGAAGFEQSAGAPPRACGDGLWLGARPIERVSGNPDAIEYAVEYRVTPQEANRRLDLQDEIGALDAALEKNEALTFAGLWIEHEPRLRIVVAFTTDERTSERTLEPYVAGTEAEDLAVVRRVGRSLQQLDRDAAAVLASAPDVPFDMGTDVRGNRVVVYTASDEADAAFADIDLPPSVEVVRVEHLSEPES